MQPLLHSWLGVFCSRTAWCQISLLSGYPRSAVLRALHSPHCKPYTPGCQGYTNLGNAHFVFVARSARHNFLSVTQLASAQAIWSGSAYASWHASHTEPCVQTCVDWCHDFPILSEHSPRRDPSQPVPVGPPPRGGGSLRISSNISTYMNSMALYGISRSPCLARAASCVPLQGCCLLVGVPPTGCLRVALFVTERYLWSFRPLTSHFLPALCACHLLCARAIAQASSGGGGGGQKGFCLKKTSMGGVSCICGLPGFDLTASVREIVISRSKNGVSSLAPLPPPPPPSQ